MAVEQTAVDGQALTTILRCDGGKALAVMGGVMMALPQHEIFIAVVIFMVLAALLVGGDGWRGDAWRVMFATTAPLIYLVVEKGLSLEPLFLVCVIAILAG